MRNFFLYILNSLEKSVIVIVCPLVQFGLTILKSSYLLVRHHKWLYTQSAFGLAALVKA